MGSRRGGPPSQRGSAGLNLICIHGFVAATPPATEKQERIHKSWVTSNLLGEHVYLRTTAQCIRAGIPADVARKSGYLRVLVAAC